MRLACTGALHIEGRCAPADEDGGPPAATGDGDPGDTVTERATPCGATGAAVCCTPRRAASRTYTGESPEGGVPPFLTAGVRGAAAVEPVAPSDSLLAASPRALVKAPPLGDAAGIPTTRLPPTGGEARQVGLTTRAAVTPLAREGGVPPPVAPIPAWRVIEKPPIAAAPRRRGRATAPVARARPPPGGVRTPATTAAARPVSVTSPLAAAPVWWGSVKASAVRVAARRGGSTIPRVAPPIAGWAERGGRAELTPGDGGGGCKSEDMFEWPSCVAHRSCACPRRIAANTAAASTSPSGPTSGCEKGRSLTSWSERRKGFSAWE